MNFKKGIFIILVLLSGLAVIKSLFVSFDIDEGYAIAQSYRLLKGDILLKDMWEPHQLSAFASALCMLPFLLITGGDTTGIILYLRIIGTIIHLLIGFWFFRVARRSFSRETSLLIALLHVNFLPKWVSIPEFEIMHYWACCIIFLSLLTWHREHRAKRYLIFAGVAFFVTMMCYPTMIILYPFYITAILLLSGDYPKERLKSALYFTLPVVILGVTLLLYIFTNMSLADFLENIGYVLMDESHSVSLLDRCRQYFGELQDFTLQFLVYFLISLCIAMGIYKISRKRNKSPEKMSISPAALLISIGLFSLTQIICSLLGNENQFYMYFRFLAVVILGIAGTALYKKESFPYFMLGILPGLLSVAASAAITNMTLEIALARIYVGVMATGFILASILKEHYSTDQILKDISCFVSVLFIGSLLMCKLLLVRVTGCIPISIKMYMDPVTEGPAAGLLLKEELAEQYNTNIPLLREYVDADDRLLYFGCENIYYLATDAEIATPSTQGTSVFNEMYLLYYEEHPEKMPNVVIIDKTFQTNSAYNYSYQNQIVLDWITEEFKDAEVVETEYLIIMRK